MPRALNGGIHGNGVSLQRHSETSDSGFLTRAQQEVLDAAVLEKQKSGQLVRTKSHSEEQPTVRLGRAQSSELRAKDRLHDRQSRSRSDRCLGKPKKGGAGGKYNWGGSLDVEENGCDPEDPNYDSCEDMEHGSRLQTKQSVQAMIYKEAVVSIIKEYFLSGDAQEATTSLQDLDQPEFAHYFVKRLVTIALDQQDREREMASSLLSTLYAVVLSAEQIARGFLAIAESVEDLSLDVPAADDLVAHFIARAVTDDILPPAFLSQLSSVEGQAEAEVRHKAEALLGGSHSAERILRCWGGEADMSFGRIRDSIAKLLQEYACCGDVGEAVACVRRIGLPLVHHELVKQALRMALEHEPQRQKLCELLAYLSSTGLVSEDQLVKGFKRVSDSMEDLTLDVPHAAGDFAAICATAKAAGWLPANALVQDGGMQPLRSTAAMTHSLQAFKKASLAAIKEYYCSGDAAEVARCLQELNEPGFHSLVVKQAMQLAMEAKDREREMTVQLIRELTPQLLSKDQVALGFTRLLACAEDLTLDSPAMPHQLALVLGRIIVDEVLPPAFLTAVLPSLSNQSLGVSIVQATGKILSARHAAERLQICWHSGTRSIEDLRASIQDLVKEFLASSDAEEAARCWHDLDVSFFGHQLVFTILVAAFEAPAQAQLLQQLIQRFALSGEVSQTQIKKGFERVEAQLSDLKLDYPGSPQQFDAFKATAMEHGWLSVEAAPSNC